MIRLFLHFKIFSFLLLPLFFLSGQNQGQSIAERLAELKARSNVHENQVSQLLAERPLGRTDFTIPNNEAVPVLPPPPPPSIVPAVPEARRVEQQDEVIPVPIEPATLAEANDQNNSTESKEDLDEAYAKLYEPDIPSRLEGYYFGPILGLVFPQDGAIRTLIPRHHPPLTQKKCTIQIPVILSACKPVKILAVYVLKPSIPIIALTRLQLHLHYRQVFTTSSVVLSWKKK